MIEALAVSRGKALTSDPSPNSSIGCKKVPIQTYLNYKINFVKIPYTTGPHRRSSLVVQSRIVTQRWQEASVSASDTEFLSVWQLFGKITPLLPRRAQFGHDARQWPDLSKYHLDLYR